MIHLKVATKCQSQLKGYQPVRPSAQETFLFGTTRCRAPFSCQLGPLLSSAADIARRYTESQILMLWTAPATGIAMAITRQLLQSADSQLLAISRSPGQAVGTTGLPPATDIRAPKSAFALISSAVPPGADSQDGGADSPKVTRTCHGGL